MMRPLFNFLFPPFCLHCDRELAEGSQFCRGCSGFFELIDPSSRCLYCFAENDARAPCRECVQKKRWRVKMAAALDYMGPVCTLVKKLKYGQMPYLAKTGGAFMLAQFCRLEWPLPDFIIPVPRRHWFQGKNHALLLAAELSHALQVPCRSLIKRRAGDISQARLPKKEREKLGAASFYIKEIDLNDKTVLLIDDVATTGTTIRLSAETLGVANPKTIYALTLARSC